MLRKLPERPSVYTIFRRGIHLVGTTFLLGTFFPVISLMWLAKWLDDATKVEPKEEENESQNQEQPTAAKQPRISSINHATAGSWIRAMQDFDRF